MLFRAAISRNWRSFTYRGSAMKSTSRALCQSSRGVNSLPSLAYAAARYSLTFALNCFCIPLIWPMGSADLTVVMKSLSVPGWAVPFAFWTVNSAPTDSAADLACGWMISEYVCCAAWYCASVTHPLRAAALMSAL